MCGSTIPEKGFISGYLSQNISIPAGFFFILVFAFLLTIFLLTLPSFVAFPNVVGD